MPIFKVPRQFFHHKEFRTYLFFIALILVSFLGYFLLNTEWSFWRGDPSAVVSYCTNRQDYGPGNCTSNSVCVTTKYCGTSSQNFSGGANEQHLCKYPYGEGMIRIRDCCRYGYAVNGVCPPPSSTVTPTATAAPVKKFCDKYISYPKGTCTNTACPSGRSCAATSLSGAKSGDGKLCVDRGVDDFIQDCCPTGKVKNSSGTACVDEALPECPRGLSCASSAITGNNLKCASGTQTVWCCPSGKVVNDARTACVSPQPTAPIKIDCKEYITYPLNTCKNDTCSTGSGQKCAAKSLTNAAQQRCVTRGGGIDEVQDCCPAGKVISGSSCVSSTAPTTTSTPNPTSNPSTQYCLSYSTSYTNKTCTNKICPADVQCARESLSNNAEGTCIKRTTVEKVYDCCAPGQTIQNGACVSANNPTSLPTIIQTTTSPTNVPTESVSPTNTTTGTPSDTEFPTTSGSPTVSSSPSVTTSIPPVTASKTPSVTHAPSETGFAEDILVYVGVALYVIGVVAFMAARYVREAKRIRPV